MDPPFGWLDIAFLCGLASAVQHSTLNPCPYDGWYLGWVLMSWVSNRLRDQDNRSIHFMTQQIMLHAPLIMNAIARQRTFIHGARCGMNNYSLQRSGIRWTDSLVSGSKVLLIMDWALPGNPTSFLPSPSYAQSWCLVHIHEALRLPHHETKEPFHHECFYVTGTCPSQKMGHKVNDERKEPWWTGLLPGLSG